MNPSELLSAFTWRDALDFGVLFLIAYSLLRVAKGTRLVPVLIAVAAFGLLALIVDVLDLIGVAILLKYVIEYIIIILIVVFQKELRRVLFYLGQRLLPAGRRQAQASAIGELVTGLERLQRGGIGALVILQGTLDVLEVASDHGREIDSPMKADTLVALAIPHPANIAHDGGILVQDLRIARAGVICPLTEQEVDPRFGTRHRGAIGASEETDSLVIVLSEERRGVRLAHRGRISAALQMADLEARITTWIEEPRADVMHAPSEAASETGGYRRVPVEPNTGRGDAGDSAADLARMKEASRG